MPSTRRRRLIAACAAIPLLPAAWRASAHGDRQHAKKPAAVEKEQKEWGIAGERKAARRTIDVRMLDTMRFTPERIDAKLGETLRFRISNTGKVVHEFVIGTKHENEAHAALMMKFPDMEHDEPYMAHVAPGKTGEIVWTFNRAGEFEFACLIAGHYQSGMVGTIKVAQARKAEATADMTEGEVRKVDVDAAKITLKHAEIRNLDMPAMTMVFVVNDKALLAGLKAGDKVRFKAVNEAGKYTITDLQVVR